MKLDSVNDRVNVSVSYSFGPESTSKSRVVSDPLSKRVFDISLASMGLGISAPLWALISVLSGWKMVPLSFWSRRGLGRGESYSASSNFGPWNGMHKQIQL